MLLGLATAALVLTALVWVLAWPSLRAGCTRARARVRTWRAELTHGPHATGELDYDPGRERRAEQRARALLRSCVNEHEWAMYRDLGFLRVFGRSGARYAYLIYPHKPIVAYVPRTGALLSEYCVAFPDHSRPYGSARLPDSDDVLAKWMALRADERGLIADANMHLPGRQVDPQRVRRDLARLVAWEREHDESMPRATSARTTRKDDIAHDRAEDMPHAVGAGTRGGSNVHGEREEMPQAGNAQHARHAGRAAGQDRLAADNVRAA
jgi:hypothetical protein